MPGGDRTGPAGMGPMTGRAAGFCAGYSVPGYANPIGGRGLGSGGGRGFGFGRGLGLGFRGGRGWGVAPYAAPVYPYGAQPVLWSGRILKSRQGGRLKDRQNIEDALEGINKRIADPEAKTKETK